jgi:DNA-binding transcriptional ArsR family regulator
VRWIGLLLLGNEPIEIGLPVEGRLFRALTGNHMVAYNMDVEKQAVVSAADLVFKALADSGRRRLLDRLRVKGGLTLNGLCEGMGMSRQAVTKHLDQLEEAGLVETRRVGRERLHYLNPVPIHDLARRWIRPFEAGRLDALRNLKSQLES